MVRPWPNFTGTFAVSSSTQFCTRLLCVTGGGGSSLFRREAGAAGRTIRQLDTLASIVEKETARPEAT